MTKWKCVNEDCTGKCELYTERVPFDCIEDDGCAEWEKVIEEPTTDCIQLPDWCKVGEWVAAYDRFKKEWEYFKIREIKRNCIAADNGLEYSFYALKPARLRQFILDEMKALVGKLFKDTDDNIFLATSYLCHRGGLLIGGYYYNAGELLDSSLTIDSKPCGVFEHLEDGEWKA